MPEFITEAQVEQAIEYLRTSASPAAQARANRIYVEEYLKVVKAQIMKEHDGPISGQEREALADPRYAAHLDAIREAVAIDEKNRFLRSAAEARIEAWRTQSSNERANRL